MAMDKCSSISSPEINRDTQDSGFVLVGLGVICGSSEATQIEEIDIRT